MQTHRVIRRSKLVLALSLSSVITACSAGQTGAPPISQAGGGNITSTSYAKLQFAVGTANIYGNAQAGLNIVSTYRQSSGTSATGVNTPTITGPFTFSATPVEPSGADSYATFFGGGPSLPETKAASPELTGTPQTVHPGTPACDSSTSVGSFMVCPSGVSPNTSTFGQSGGVFANGLAPYNANGGSGQAYSYAPYAQPMLDDADTQVPLPPQFVPWGGPPAFDPRSDGMGLRDGLGVIGTDGFGDPYFLGIPEGITAFTGAQPAAGTYTLSVAIATNTTGTVSTSTVTQTASLTSTAVLPTITPAMVPAVTPDASGDGGATFTVAALPAGVTEELVQIVDYGPGGAPGTAASAVNCQGNLGPFSAVSGPFAPVYYTIEVTGAGTYTLPATDGPNANASSGGTKNLAASPSICTAAQNTSANGGTATAADNFTEQVIGFDYPAYEAALSVTKGQETPAITGSNGQADLTLSVPVEYSWSAGAYTSTPL